MGDFWNIPQSSKIDTLKEGDHDDKIFDAIRDVETNILPGTNNQFILYGKDQGLVTAFRSFPYKFFMWLCMQCLNYSASSSTK